MTGYIKVNASPSFSSAPTTSGFNGWNCTGQPIKARRRGIGEYDVVFYGQDYLIETGVGSADYSQPGTSVTVSNAYQIGYENPGPNDWPYPTVGVIVRVRNSSGAAVDAPFQLITVPRY